MRQGNITPMCFGKAVAEWDHPLQLCPRDIIYMWRIMIQLRSLRMELSINWRMMEVLQRFLRYLERLRFVVCVFRSKFYIVMMKRMCFMLLIGIRRWLTSLRFPKILNNFQNMVHGNQMNLPIDIELFLKFRVQEVLFN